MAGTSLLDWLRAQDDATLATLLRLRPDLGVPPPSDLTVLATRAGVRASVNRACEDLETPTLAVLEALVVAGAEAEPTGAARIAELFGSSMPKRRLSAALGLLRERALVWGGDEELRLVPAALEVVSRYPGGLGRPAESVSDPAKLRELLADTPADEQRVLEALVAGPPIGRSQEPGARVIQRLISRGLLLRVDPSTVELPRQVGLELRGAAPLRSLVPAEPKLATTRPGAERVDGTAAGAVLELLRHAETLIEAWGHEPPPVLRSGGLGVRDLRRAARDLGLTEPQTGLLVEVLAAAGLIADSEAAGGGEWVPTTQADLWAAGGPEQRWLALARAWLELPRLPGLIGQRDDGDKVLGALSEELRRPLAPRDRRRVLNTLTELPEGEGVVDPEALAAVLTWRAPRRGGRMRDAQVTWTVDEATLLGLVALGALTGPGRALLRSADTGDTAPVLSALRQALPEPVDHVLLQADLTAVAPGPLRADVAEEMALVADVESSGAASVYRITEASLLRALDAGRAPTELHQLFATRSATPVPQGLTYLIDDVARRHGRVRGGTARSFLRADDEVLLTEVLAHPGSDDWELRQIAPTVLISELPLAQLLDGLRAAGFSPAAEAGDGTVVDLRPRGRRISAKPRAAARADLPALDENRLSALVASIRAGERAATMRPTGPAHTDADTNGAGNTLELLRGAARERRSVWIGYVNSLGVASRRIVEPVSVAGGVLEGYDRLQGDLRRFMLHRITSAVVMDPETEAH
ncbi:helicase-associated domain-containing protein [Pseudonocardia eucalypti]|uniref:Helicase-associated domain-containing protein n=1 Tax=Pseudonocardia eucalypti TaxID=648755 RepID=A0ABP9PGQ6_9PSEU|nr:hypothetical protein [Pseudonocardia eucalypti]